MEQLFSQDESIEFRFKGLTAHVQKKPCRTLLGADGGQPTSPSGRQKGSVPSLPKKKKKKNNNKRANLKEGSRAPGGTQFLRVALIKGNDWG